MKRLLFATTALAVFAAGASAYGADMPVTPAYQPPPAPPPPVYYNWSGCYVGLHAGIAQSNVEIADNGNAAHHPFAPLGTPGQKFNASDDSLFGGGQLGCNLQVNSPFVVGFESDLGWIDMGPTALDPGSVNTTVGLGSGFYGDITARGGYALGSALFYVKGGWAFYNGKETFSSSLPTTNVDVALFNGWALGAGVEYRLSYNWSAKLEYLHLGLGKQNFFVQSAGGVFQFNEKLSLDTLKIGVNYKFY